MMFKWIKHDGRGRPVPVGTLVSVMRFNGDTDQFLAGQQGVIDATGHKIADGIGRYSTWDHGDGGPMSVKVKYYRILTRAKTVARNAAMFRDWLEVREKENV